MVSKSRGRYKPNPSADKVVSPDSKETYKPLPNQDRDKNAKQNPYGDIKPKIPEMPKKTKPKPEK